MDKSDTRRITNNGQAVDVPVALAIAIDALCRPEWALLLQYYSSVKFEVHLQSKKEPIIKAVVSK